MTWHWQISKMWWKRTCTRSNHLMPTAAPSSTPWARSRITPTAVTPTSTPPTTTTQAMVWTTWIARTSPSPPSTMTSVRLHVLSKRLHLTYRQPLISPEQQPQFLHPHVCGQQQHGEWLHLGNKLFSSRSSHSSSCGLSPVQWGRVVSSSPVWPVVFTVTSVEWVSDECIW